MPNFKPQSTPENIKKIKFKINTFFLKIHIPVELEGAILKFLMSCLAKKKGTPLHILVHEC